MKNADYFYDKNKNFYLLLQDGHIFLFNQNSLSFSEKKVSWWKILPEENGRSFLCLIHDGIKTVIEGGE